MTAGQSWDRRLRRRLAVLGLALFTYLTAEMFPVGALPEIADGLSVDQGTAGLLLSGYAAVAGVAAIPVVMMTAHQDRRRLMTASMLLLAVSQCLMAIAPNFEVALATRAIAALAHGVVWALVPVVAGVLAPVGTTGRATAGVFVGSSMGLVLGTPLSAALSQAIGWRGGSFVLAAVALATAALLRSVLPATPAAVEASPDGQPAPRTRWTPVALICLVTILAVLAHYVSYTYLAVLLRPIGFSGTSYALLLAVYGLAGLVGIRIVGAVVDARPYRTSLGLLLVLVAALMLLAAVGRTSAFVAVPVVLMWAAAFSAAPVVLQSAILRVAPGHADRASAIYVVAFQIGIAGGSAAGAAVLDGFGSSALPWTSAVIGIGAAVVLVVSPRTFGSGITPEPLPVARIPGCGTSRNH